MSSLAVKLDVMYKDHNIKYWDQYAQLDGKFWKETKQESEPDLDLARMMTEGGIRGYVLALDKERVVGFHRFDPMEVEDFLGATYVEKDFRRKDVALVDTPWVMGGDRLFFLLHKAAYLIARGVGWDHNNIGSHGHNDNADRAMEWRETNRKILEREVENNPKPEIFEVIRAYIS